MNGYEIAVIGMAGRFPGATSVAELWEKLLTGRTGIRDLPAPNRGNTWVARAADVADPDRFDAGFFGVTAREAALTDPQHRMFLECGWEALEDAGWSRPTSTGGSGCSPAPVSAATCCGI
jgi:acyl transferase domain-containing protein